MVRTTREQRCALMRVYQRGTVPFRSFIADKITIVNSYRQFRKCVQPTFGCDGAITVYWAGMWLAIERDGYTHS